MIDIPIIYTDIADISQKWFGVPFLKHDIHGARATAYLCNYGSCGSPYSGQDLCVIGYLQMLDKRRNYLVKR